MDPDAWQAAAAAADEALVAGTVADAAEDAVAITALRTRVRVVASIIVVCFEHEPSER